MLLCLIAACLNVFSYAEADSSVIYEPSDTTTTIILEFGEVLSAEGLFDINNFSVKDSLNHSYSIFKIGLIQEINGVPIGDKTMVAVITERLPYKKKYFVLVEHLKDLSGNLIKDKNKGEFFYNGFKPGMIIPSVNFN